MPKIVYWKGEEPGGPRTSSRELKQARGHCEAIKTNPREDYLGPCALWVGE
jgi:hypothetical protein